MLHDWLMLLNIKHSALCVLTTCTLQYCLLQDYLPCCLVSHKLLVWSCMMLITLRCYVAQYQLTVHKLMIRYMFNVPQLKLGKREMETNMHFIRCTKHAQRNDVLVHWCEAYVYNVISTARLLQKQTLHASSIIDTDLLQLMLNTLQSSNKMS